MCAGSLRIIYSKYAAVFPVNVEKSFISKGKKKVFHTFALQFIQNIFRVAELCDLSARKRRCGEVTVLLGTFQRASGTNSLLEGAA